LAVIERIQVAESASHQVEKFGVLGAEKSNVLQVPLDDLPSREAEKLSILTKLASIVTDTKSEIN
jgi:hypothetical protein